MGTTYFATAAGNDANNGLTIGTAWRSIKINSLSPGDTIMVNDGDTFAPIGLVTVSGTTGNPITVQGYPSFFGTGLPIVQLGNTDRYGAHIQDVEYITINGLLFQSAGWTVSGQTITPNGGIAANWGNVGVFIQSTTLTRANPFRGINIDNCIFTQVYNGVVCIAGGGPLVGQGGTTYASFPILSSIVGFDGLQCVGCTFHDIPTIGFKCLGQDNPAGGAPFGTGYYFTNLLVDSFSAHDLTGDPSYNDGIPQPLAIQNAQNVTVSNFVIDNNGVSCRNGGSGPAGIFTIQVDSFVIEDGIVTRTNSNGSFDGTGIDGDGNSTNGKIRRCITGWNSGGGIVIGNFTGTPYIHTNNIEVEGCVSINDGTKINGGIFTFSGPTNVTFYNCTVIQQSGIVASGSACMVIDSAATGKFYNCLFLTTGGVKLGIGTNTGFTFDGNGYWTAGGAFSLFGNSWAAWQAGGNDTHGFNADPVLSHLASVTGPTSINTSAVFTSNYFDLGGGSAAIGTGRNLASLFGLGAPPASDFHSHLFPNAVPVPAWDVGACLSQWSPGVALAPTAGPATIAATLTTAPPPPSALTYSSTSGPAAAALSLTTAPPAPATVVLSLTTGPAAIGLHVDTITGNFRMQFTTTDRNARLQTLKTNIGSGGTIKFWTGSPPGIANAATGTLLSTLTALVLGTPAAGAMSVAATADPSAAATGTAGYYRMLDSGGAPHAEGPCAIGSSEGNFNAIVNLNGSVTLTSGTITEGNA